MKTLYLDVEFNTDEHYDWSLVPAGTKCSYEKFEWHGCEETYTNGKLKDDTSWIIDKYKNVIEQFMDNVTGVEANIVQDVLNDVLNKNWDESFDVRNYDGHGDIHVKFYIEDKDSSVPYTFNLTQEQIDDITYIMHTVYNYEDIGESKLKNMAVDKMITAWYNYTSDKYNQRKDNSYKEQDLLDALDDATSYNDGAAYDTIEGFIKDYFNGYI